jgi:putative tricarboxylic transport membrane protein
MVDFDLASASDLKKEVLRVQLDRRLRVWSSKETLRAWLIAAAPYALIFAAGAFLYRSADRIEFDRVEGRIGPDLWPKLIIILMMVACVWGAIKAAFAASGLGASTAVAACSSHSDTSKMEEQDERDLDEVEIYPWRVWGTIAGTVAYLVSMPYLGFFLGSALFIAYVIYLGGYRKIVPVLVLSVAGSLFFMTIFIRVVYVSLPIGIEPFDRVSVALMKIINL